MLTDLKKRKNYQQNDIQQRLFPCLLILFLYNFIGCMEEEEAISKTKKNKAMSSSASIADSKNQKSKIKNLS